MAVKKVARSVTVGLCLLIATGLFFPLDAAGIEAQAEAIGMILPKERLTAPDFTLKDLKGNLRTLEDVKGDVVFLYFWATWCVPCRTEIPTLTRLQTNFKDKGFKVITLAVDRGSFNWTKKTVGRYIKKYGVGVDVLLDNKSEARRLYEISVLPTTYVIGRDGKFIGKIVGGREWNSAESHELFRDILE